jgi:hypothetical protein
MNGLLHLLRTHWRLIVLVLIVLLLLPAVVAALVAAEAPPEPAAIPVEEASEPAITPAIEPAAEPLSEPAAPPAAAPAGEPQGFDEYREMIERPLFSNTRRPPVLKDAPQANLDAQQLREAWRLSGIALHQGRQLASFSERQGELRLLLEEGMVLADQWRLEHIGSDHVLLSNGVGEVRLPLREPIVAEAPEDKKDKQGKKNKQDKSEKTTAPAAPTDKTTPPADTPAPAAPAQ